MTALQVKEITITGCLPNCSFFQGSSKLIVIDLRKNQPLNVDPKAIQKIVFTGNL